MDCIRGAVHTPEKLETAGSSPCATFESTYDWLELRTWALQTARTALRAAQRASTLSFQEPGAHIRPKSFWTRFEAAHFRLAQSIRARHIPSRLLDAIPLCLRVPPTDSEAPSLFPCSPAHPTGHPPVGGSVAAIATADAIAATAAGDPTPTPFMRHEPCHGACTALACTPEALELFAKEDPATHAFGVHIRRVSEALASRHALSFHSLASSVARDAACILRSVRDQTSEPNRRHGASLSQNYQRHFRRPLKFPLKSPLKSRTRSGSGSSSSSATNPIRTSDESERSPSESSEDGECLGEHVLPSHGGACAQRVRVGVAVGVGLEQDLGQGFDWKDPDGMRKQEPMSTHDQSDAASSASVMSRFSSALAASAMKGCAIEVAAMDKVLDAYAAVMTLNSVSLRRTHTRRYGRRQTPTESESKPHDAEASLRFPCLRSLACFLIHSQLWRGLLPSQPLHDPLTLLPLALPLNSQLHANANVHAPAPAPSRTPEAPRVQTYHKGDSKQESIHESRTSADWALHYSALEPQDPKEEPKALSNVVLTRPAPFLFKIEYDLVRDSAAARAAQAKGITLIRKRMQGEWPAGSSTDHRF